MMQADADPRTHAGRRIAGVAQILALSILSAIAVPGLRAHDAHQGHAQSQPTSQEAAEGVSVPREIALRNQDGERVQVYRDLIEGKVVAINTIYTSCVTICPTIGVYFAELQRDQRLAGRIGRDLSLISISIDPGIDTPERLKDWSQRLGALPGWTLLTGNKAQVQALLEGLGIQFPGDDKTTHSQLVLIGSEPAGKWTYVRGDASPNDLAEAIGAALEAH